MVNVFPKGYFDDDRETGFFRPEKKPEPVDPMCGPRDEKDYDDSRWP